MHVRYADLYNLCNLIHHHIHDYATLRMDNLLTTLDSYDQTGVHGHAGDAERVPNHVLTSINSYYIAGASLYNHFVHTAYILC